VSTTEWMVVAGGLAAIAWVNWYFFIAGRTGGAGTVRSDTSEENRGTYDGDDRR
jgi:hypothetical protein